MSHTDAANAAVEQTDWGDILRDVEELRQSLAEAEEREAARRRIRLQAEQFIDGMARVSYAGSIFGFSLGELEGAFGRTNFGFGTFAHAITPEAERRAEAYLASLLTPGEQRALEALKVVPVLGAETGDLWLVSRKYAYNLLRYERSSPPPFPAGSPTLYCSSPTRTIPRADMVASLVLMLRGPEGELLRVANRFASTHSISDPLGGEGKAERKLYRKLRALAECRCRDERLLRRTLKAAERLPALA